MNIALNGSSLLTFLTYATWCSCDRVVHTHSISQTLVGNRRALLRRGEDLAPVQDEGPQKGALVAVPLFHVTGLTSYSMMATMLGYKIVLMRKWIPDEG